MKTIIFDDTLDKESIQTLIDDIEQPHVDDPEKDLLIYFSSDGGYWYASQMLIRCLNNLPKTFSVKIVFFWRIYSAAFNVLIDVKCEKEVLDGAVALLHLLDRDVSSREYIHDKTSFSKFLVDDMNRYNEKYLAWMAALPGFLSEDDVKVLSEGRDVYADSVRINDLLENLKKKKRNER